MKLKIIKFSGGYEVFGKTMTRNPFREGFTGNFAQDIPESTWDCGGGGTSFGPPLKAFFEYADEIIA